MVEAGALGDTPRMIRRLVALALWTYFSWYLAAMVATLLDGPAAAGPIAAVITAIVGIVGWRRDGRRQTIRLTTQPSQ